ncbi:MAG: SsrA-binding protein SmpB [Bacilli bacterium]|nr:SsrA-binding protein SmpB [Bacilli bacterium]MBR1748708.1 SsrA-binding protein SmpB [Bacilli bacterium]MBR1817538.1 SsrA-binding protein SmpB [Bacilli bacterium]
MEIKNKKAYFDYEILKEIEAGIELKGTEIKSIRKGSCDLKDSFVIIKNKEAYVLNMYIAKYEQGNQFNHEERRTRKLLLHKEETKRLREEKEKEGISIIPLKMYLKNNHVKLLIGIAKGKKLYDKRESIKKRDLEREQKNLY